MRITRMLGAALCAALATSESGVLADTKTVESYMFGHSLVVHPTDTDETSLPYWLDAFAKAAGHRFTVTGQFGSMVQHANLPPRPAWGWAGIATSWDEETGQSFADTDIDLVMLTATNYIQGEAPTEPYGWDNPRGLSPVSATLEVIDWVLAEKPDAAIAIYEHWPDMAPFVQEGFFGGGGFPPDAEAFAEYNAYTRGAFHDWWVDYHARLVEARPEATITLIPVGPLLAGLFTETALSEVPTEALYEDDAPHGRPTLYFLASLVIYEAFYGEPAPADFALPESIHPIVRENYGAVRDYLSQGLRAG